MQLQDTPILTSQSMFPIALSFCMFDTFPLYVNKLNAELSYRKKQLILLENRPAWEDFQKFEKGDHAST